LFYGEEIGMAENLDVAGRFAVRTPMQWTDGVNGGFSTAAKRRLPRPLPDGLYGPERVNAAGQRHDHRSFWWFIRDLIYTYRQQPEIGWSTAQVLEQPNPAVLAHACREASGWMMIGLHNFGADGCLVPLELADAPAGSQLVDLLDGRDAFPLDDHGRIELQLGPYGYRWLRLLRPG
ncbi:trehalose synthase, partial [Mycobacterium sp. ITM-2017-0098]